MASLFILLVLMAFMFLLVGIRDICSWLYTKNELKSVNRWNQFREFGEENKNHDLK